MSGSDIHIDADELLQNLEEKSWQLLEKEGFTQVEIEIAKRKKHYKDNVVLYSYISEFGDEHERLEAFHKLAVALNGLNRRSEAVKALQRGIAVFPESAELKLTLAKILFKNDEKEKAKKLCEEIYVEKDTHCCSKRQLADAYYIAGWASIHLDNHTEAYKTWLRGFEIVDEDDRLQRQRHKRNIWDLKWEGEAQSLNSLIGKGHIFKRNTLSEEEIKAYLVPEDIQEPALALFDSRAQSRKAVFKTKVKILTPDECIKVCDIVTEHANNIGGWKTVRNSTVPTTDVAVEDIPILRGWLQQLMESRLKPMLKICFPKLADGTDLGVNGERVRIHDAFIVRYDAKRDMSISLPEHCDTSAFSFTVALNDDFIGGGTWFESLVDDGNVVTAELGEAIAFAGPLRHAGYPIQSGVRLILVLFLYVQDYDYGPYLQRAYSQKSQGSLNCYLESHKISGTKPSGNEPGSYVVYRETIELMNALEIVE